MTSDEFRRHGYAAIDWIVSYWDRLDTLPVTPPVRPGDTAALLPPAPPTDGEDFAAMLADLDRVVVPGLTHWQHPGHFAYFPANTSGPSVLADLICAGVGVQGMLWATGPSCTEVEIVMMDWLADLLALPERFRSGSGAGGVIQDSASSATLVATLAALHRASGGRWRSAGLGAARYAVYTSTQGHSSIEKAARIAGLGDGSVRAIAVDPQTLAMDPDALRAALDQDRAAGVTPAIVVATVGTTSTTAVDPLPAIGALCREYGAWLHVDAAYAGAAAACPELRWIHDGLEFADSYCFDPHKWMLTGFDCDAFWVADAAELVDALTVLPEYLRNAATESGAVVDFRDWHVPLGRRFRALKLWFVLRWYGVEGVRGHIRTGVRLAQRFAAAVRSDDRFEVVAPHPLSLVCFRLNGEDGPNEDLLRAVNATGRCLLTHTRVAGRHVLRLAVGAPATREEHVDEAWRIIQEAATAVAVR
jgi:aromatic-L-amino-acid/L-tryptophan decarboxylase